MSKYAYGWTCPPTWINGAMALTRDTGLERMGQIATLTEP